MIYSDFFSKNIMCTLHETTIRGKPWEILGHLPKFGNGYPQYVCMWTLIIVQVIMDGLVLLACEHEHIVARQVLGLLESSSITVK